MKVYVLTTIDYDFAGSSDRCRVEGVFESIQDAKQHVYIQKELKAWDYDDYDIEEFDL